MIRPTGRPSSTLPLAIDHAVMPSLRRMMRVGIAIDIPYLRDLSATFHSEMLTLEKDIVSMIPPEGVALLKGANGDEDEGDDGWFNVNSPQQVATLLFEILKLGDGKVLKTTKTGDRLATDKKQLELLKEESEIVGLLLRYKRLAKLKSTYADALPVAARFHPRGFCCPVCELPHEADTYRVHTRFSTTRAGTGRLASSDPNLQNIPARTDEGAMIRAAFIASPGKMLISCDYSQIELRLLAHCAREAVMIAIYQAGQDIHVETAKAAFNIPDPKAIPKDEWKNKYRAPAKTVNFGVVYGMSGKGLYAQMILMFSENKIPIPSWLTEEWCEQFIARWFALYPQVKAFIDHEHHCARRYGMVWTDYGRTRPVPQCVSVHRRIVEEGLRQAGNLKIQGTAADINKLGLTAVYDELASLRDCGVEGLLSVHDEWVGEAPIDIAWDVAKLVEQAMTSVAVLRVPFLADSSVMLQWSK
jgi:DNA polymerase-1